MPYKLANYANDFIKNDKCKKKKENMPERNLF